MLRMVWWLVWRGIVERLLSARGSGSGSGGWGLGWRVGMGGGGLGLDVEDWGRYFFFRSSGCFGGLEEWFARG